jgi:hypothetical protein
VAGVTAGLIGPGQEVPWEATQFGAPVPGTYSVAARNDDACVRMERDLQTNSKAPDAPDHLRRDRESDLIEVVCIHLLIATRETEEAIRQRVPLLPGRRAHPLNTEKKCIKCSDGIADQSTWAKPCT